MFDAQVDMLREFYRIEPGEVDLPGFPLFSLFNAAMRVTTVVPDMDPTKPARVDPLKILDAVRDNQVTQAFGSPAFWNRVGRHCEEHGVTFPTIRRGLSAGAPVPVPVLRRMSHILTAPGADMHTPYGATESLPVCSISGSEVLNETAAATAQGAGTCIGRPFPGVDVKIIAITLGPIATLAEAVELAPGEVGEIIVRSPSTTREYFRRPEATAHAKIADGDRFWHRMGDVGYLDATGRLWFCGRKAHIVRAAQGPMFTERCEPVFNEHPRVYRTALVGVPVHPKPGDPQRPALVVELEAGQTPRSEAERMQLLDELRSLARANPLTTPINTFLFHPSLPVDTRHNVKIRREELAEWAEGKVGD
jgi:acyl-CoA synthetase (AMP-forming)/AMP-acid ligase II